LRVNTCLKPLRVALRLVFILRKEQHSDTQGLARAQEDFDLAKQIIARDGGLHADAVAAFAIGGDCAAMREPAERGQCKAQNFVFGASVKGRNESYAAGFVFEAGIEEVVSTRRKAATTHGPLYMEFAVQMKREIHRAQKVLRSIICSD
jgi:hypothetical protein